MKTDMDKEEEMDMGIYTEIETEKCVDIYTDKDNETQIVTVKRAKVLTELGIEMKRNIYTVTLTTIYKNMQVDKFMDMKTVANTEKVSQHNVKTETEQGTGTDTQGLLTQLKRKRKTERKLSRIR